MKLLSRKNQHSGFTLVELILIIGLISVMTIGIYIKYRSISTDNSVQLQVQDLYTISNKITNAYQSTTSMGTIDNAFVINNNLVPSELITGNNIISRFGTTLTFANVVVNGNAGYEIKIDNITNRFCALIGTSKFANDVDEVILAGVRQKTTGESLNSANVIAITNACATATNISFRNRVYYSPVQNLPVQNRPIQIGKYYIPTIAEDVNSAATSCTGGAIWNKKSNFCSCATGTEWNGSSCVSNAVGNNCIYGTSAQEGSGNNICKALPSTKAQSTVFNGNEYIVENNSFYNTPNLTNRTACENASGYWDETTSICGGVYPNKVVTTKTSPTPIYDNGRYYPQAPNGSIKNLTIPQNSPSQCAGAGGNWDGKVCNYCPSPTIINGHAASSTWDVDRCVTPSNNW